MPEFEKKSYNLFYLQSKEYFKILMNVAVAEKIMMICFIKAKKDK